MTFVVVVVVVVDDDDDDDDDEDDAAGNTLLDNLPDEYMIYYIIPQAMYLFKYIP
jgi:hypothetical protein